MAVVEVLAEINGSRCMLENTSGNIWSIVAPSYCPNGNYVCAFWAKDEAGNIAYKTAILWIVDGRLTCIKWIEDKYQLKFKLSDEYSCHHINSSDEYSCLYIKPRCTRND
ncbi:MAG: Ig-like domain-containing protein [Bacteroidaceae bacterium]|nr:Ig-like domain-containing protein [Bacteroidaceae bacterium]